LITKPWTGEGWRWRLSTPPLRTRSTSPWPPVFMSKKSGRNHTLGSISTQIRSSVGSGTTISGFMPR